MDQVYLKGTHESSDPAEFFQTVLKLKTIHRQGWKNKIGMKNPESVADHCYSTTVMAMVVSDLKKLDTEKIIKMSLLHDLAETITGDLVPGQKSKSEKEKLENVAMKTILGNLAKSQKSQYWKIWQEYQRNSSKEARLLHQIDKLEMAIQASEYKKAGFTKRQLAPFLKSAKTATTDPYLRKILSEFL
ncbi:MAG: HD domain-containing protein [Candidatus Nitrosotenuis sp.]